MSVLQLENVSMDYEEPDGSITHVLKNINLSIEEGELLTVLGPSGCGKTTLLNIMAGFIFPTKGSVKHHLKMVCGPSAKRGMVFQQGALFEWMNVRKNIAFGLAMQKKPKQEINKKVDQLLSILKPVAQIEHLVFLVHTTALYQG